MNNIKLMNKIAECGTDLLDRKYYNVSADVENESAVMVRSATLHEMKFNDNLLAIARCGAGVNNIPIDRCTEEGIVVFNTPGANANGVKELAICALMLSARDIVGGIEWAKTLKGTEGVAKAVEGGKSAFGGTELAGKTLGVIGLGAIGGMVANVATHLGMDVIGCDPFLSVEGAWSLSRSVKRATTFEEIFEKSDYITLHVPATKDTKNMICKKSIALMKDGVRIINLSRADLVCSEDIKEATASGKVAKYVTDFPTEDVLDSENIICIPHLGASTAESEDNCAIMAAKELDAFIRFGTIRNSVNFPNVELPETGELRICLLHANVPSVLSQISGALSEQNINIENLINKSKSNNAYTVVDINGTLPEEILQKLQAINGMIKIRTITL